MNKLRMHGWYVKVCPSFLGSVGFPDLFAAHYNYGHRWIEVKLAKGSTLTAAQQEFFPKYREAGWRVWFLRSTEDIKLLMKPPNWDVYDLMIFRGQTKKSDSYVRTHELESGPEWELQRKIISDLSSSGWYCRHIKGNAARSGWPDLYVAHPKIGGKFVEVKHTVSFTDHQLREFRELYAKRVPLYFFLPDYNIDSLLGRPDWSVFVDYLKDLA